MEGEEELRPPYFRLSEVTLSIIRTATLRTQSPNIIMQAIPSTRNGLFIVGASPGAAKLCVYHFESLFKPLLQLFHFSEDTLRPRINS